jgi:CheY-like chemotaxis protein
MTTLRKVLVVDDDPVVRKSFDRVLSDKGYAVITAESGEEAMRKLAEEKYDAVYTDIRMPGMSGLEVAEQVKARKPWTPVVIITGYGTEAAEARAKAAGVTSFLHKPLSPEVIEDSARSVTESVDKAEAILLPVPPLAPAIALEAAPEKEPGTTNPVLNLLLFLAAPFIGLAYVIALPFVGSALLAKIAWTEAAKNARIRSTLRACWHFGMMLGAPLIGLVFFIFFPVFGIAALLWTGGKAALRR